MANILKCRDCQQPNDPADLDRAGRCPKCDDEYREWLYEECKADAEFERVGTTE